MWGAPTNNFFCFSSGGVRLAGAEAVTGRQLVPLRSGLPFRRLALTLALQRCYATAAIGRGQEILPVLNELPVEALWQSLF
ncbi:MAG: hypothetical protein AAB289_15500 [Chloroflexota bacterium]